MTKEEFNKLVVGDTVYYNKHPRIYKGKVTTLDLNTKKNSLYVLFTATNKNGIEMVYSVPMHYFKLKFSVTNDVSYGECNEFEDDNIDDSLCYHCRKRHCINHRQPGMSECDQYEPYAVKR